MADTKISDLTDGTSPQDADQLVVARTGSNVKLLWSELKTALNLLYVPLTRTITAGTGLTGGGDLSANRTLTVSGVTEALLSLADNTTANVSTSAHGFAPKAPNDATKYLDGTGAYSVPSGSGGGGSGILAVAQYAPASLATYNITGALTALDTTNLTISFTVPASGAVVVEFQAVMSPPATTNVLALGLKNHSGGAQLGNTQNTVMTSAQTAAIKTVRWYLTGLSAGTLGIDIAGSVAGGTGKVFAQGVTGNANNSAAGPATIVVFTA